LDDYHALEDVDARRFQPRARLLQSIWREQQGFEPAEYSGKLRGARLPMPWARESLANFLTTQIRDVVRAEVLDDDKSAGKLYGTPRIFANLLSSQPLCFNLFGVLQRDLELASRLVADLTDDRMTTVTAVEFEYSPGRGDARYTNDSSAFDVFLETETADGCAGFVGVEVKYHENLKGTPAPHREAYERVAEAMGCFREDALPALRENPLQQIWRDHILAGAMLEADGYADGFFAFLHPADNEYCREASQAYGYCLTEDSTFVGWTLEDVVETLAQLTDEPWVGMLRDRYLGFEKLERLGGRETDR
jgi:hypothetical protein